MNPYETKSLPEPPRFDLVQAEFRTAGGFLLRGRFSPELLLRIAAYVVDCVRMNERERAVAEYDI